MPDMPLNGLLLWDGSIAPVNAVETEAEFRWRHPETLLYGHIGTSAKWDLCL